MTPLRILRNYLIKNSGKVRARRRTKQDSELCRRLDESMLGFRAARQAISEDARGSWLRAVRHATGVPVYVLAKRLGVTKYEVFRLEKADQMFNGMLLSGESTRKGIQIDR